ncbi:dTDP-4-dehydrorhamnose reductase [Periweissella ghanensis]|uniref:dTDP-4-dehydrorhamnose reductase n=1 Tax=Periweissella ghanensis TaxID=467997 RepID=A0ABN8BSD4_9LACO|nr:dTDP-4-dehydrorhamnose reductase [Periweissella ghanensis]MCM0600241.1 dTDP-4-dehydrorhamnose reductase [Periweissella ghanensis]CAH0419127.1 dTDP-4-dehydrorhamnose reductase [Periweissella ghanensis]
MKYWILGASGQLGQELVHLTKENGLDVKAYTSQELDITNLELLLATAQKEQPDVILDAAAYTKVDLAEDDGKVLNWQVNAVGTQNLVKISQAINAKLVYVSTDYVFDGTSSDEYTEDALVKPQNEYGRAKLAGEFAILNANIDAYIVRTSWVFGEYGNNFVYTMQRLAKQHKRLTIVDDQIGRPTWTKTLAQFMLHLIQVEAAYGTYHLSNDNSASWFEFAQEILKDVDVEVAPITSAEFPQKAYRPKDSVMSLAKAKATGFNIPTWQEALEEFMDNENK